MISKHLCDFCQTDLRGLLSNSVEIVLLFTTVRLVRVISEKELPDPGVPLHERHNDLSVSVLLLLEVN